MSADTRSPSREPPAKRTRLTRTQSGGIVPRRHINYREIPLDEDMKSDDSDDGDGQGGGEVDVTPKGPRSRPAQAVAAPSSTQSKSSKRTRVISSSPESDTVAVPDSEDGGADEDDSGMATPLVASGVAGPSRELLEGEGTTDSNNFTRPPTSQSDLSELATSSPESSSSPPPPPLPRRRVRSARGAKPPPAPPRQPIRGRRRVNQSTESPKGESETMRKSQSNESVVSSSQSVLTSMDGSEDEAPNDEGRKIVRGQARDGEDSDSGGDSDAPLSLRASQTRRGRGGRRGSLSTRKNPRAVSTTLDEPDPLKSPSPTDSSSVLTSDEEDAKSAQHERRQSRRRHRTVSPDSSSCGSSDDEATKAQQLERRADRQIRREAQVERRKLRAERDGVDGKDEEGDLDARTSDAEQQEDSVNKTPNSARGRGRPRGTKRGGGGFRGRGGARVEAKNSRGAGRGQKGKGVAPATPVETFVSGMRATRATVTLPPGYIEGVTSTRMPRGVRSESSTPAAKSSAPAADESDEEGVDVDDQPEIELEPPVDSATPEQSDSSLKVKGKERELVKEEELVEEVPIAVVEEVVAVVVETKVVQELEVKKEKGPKGKERPPPSEPERELSKRRKIDPEAAAKAAEIAATRLVLLEKLDREADLIKTSLHPLIAPTLEKLAAEKADRLARLKRSHHLQEQEYDRVLYARSQQVWRQWANDKDEMRMEMYLHAQEQLKELIHEEKAYPFLRDHPLLINTHNLPPTPYYRAPLSQSAAEVYPPRTTSLTTYPLEPPPLNNALDHSAWELSQDEIEDDLATLKDFSAKVVPVPPPPPVAAPPPRYPMNPYSFYEPAMSMAPVGYPAPYPVYPGAGYYPTPNPWAHQYENPAPHPASAPAQSRNAGRKPSSEKTHTHSHSHVKPHSHEPSHSHEKKSEHAPPPPAPRQPPAPARPSQTKEVAPTSKAPHSMSALLNSSPSPALSSTSASTTHHRASQPPPQSSQSVGRPPSTAASPPLRSSGFDSLPQSGSNQTGNKPRASPKSTNRYSAFGLPPVAPLALNGSAPTPSSSSATGMSFKHAVAAAATSSILGTSSKPAPKPAGSPPQPQSASVPHQPTKTSLPSLSSASISRPATSSSSAPHSTSVSKVPNASTGTSSPNVPWSAPVPAPRTHNGWGFFRAPYLGQPLSSSSSLSAGGSGGHSSSASPPSASASGGTTASSSANTSGVTLPPITGSRANKLPWERDLPPPNPFGFRP